MKRTIVIVALTLVVASCAIHKKNYYVFDWYTYKRASKPADSVSVIPAHSTENVVMVIPESSAAPTTPDRPDFKPAAEKEVSRAISTEVEVQAETIPPSITQQQEDRLVIKKPRRKNGSGLLLGIGTGVGLALALFLLGARRLVNGITRWSKENPRTAQGAIAAAQLPLIGWAIMNGYNLSQLGYDIPDPAIFGLMAATGISGATVPFLPKVMPSIELPKTVNRRRLGFASLALSSLMMFTGLGNRIDKTFPHTDFQQTVQGIDQKLFASNQERESGYSFFNSVKEERVAKAGISAAAAVFLVILLIIAACAGVCLILLGSGAGAVLGGILLLALAILGGIGVDKGREKRSMAEK